MVVNYMIFLKYNKMQINKYIDYVGLFKELFETHKQELIKERYQARHFDEILKFNSISEDFELNIEECEICDSNILFWFTYDFNDANESCTQSTTADYIVNYDRVLEKFISCEYEQG